ncbi:unnamed protein product [Heligmosomoides polygyrus]|uniref:Acyl_transf_3 domain-containing protein n=1 Tax=Heligmosomoides polygyrus TaxID=6339 RepID=A0A183GMS5_HELPZ|nr:unnamed protein product [Heligmosomoides polygyrus]
MEGIYSGENDEGGARTFVEYACLSMLLFGALCPQPLQAVYLRLNTTMATAVLISLNSRSTLPILVHFGDVSYTLYLVHWPIFCWLKLNDIDHALGLVCGLLFSWMLAVLLTETFEKFYRNAEKPVILAFIALLYGLNSSVILFTGYFNNFTQVELGYVFENSDPYINITIEFVYNGIDHRQSVSISNPYPKFCQSDHDSAPRDKLRPDTNLDI